MAATMHKSWLFTPTAGVNGHTLGPLAGSRQTVTFRACKTCAVTWIVMGSGRSVLSTRLCRHPSPKPPGARAHGVRAE
jgi:hypothetical protein